MERGKRVQAVACTLSLSKNLFFDRLAEFKKAAKTSKMSSSAYIGTVELILRSKSKSLAVQGFAGFFENLCTAFLQSYKTESSKPSKNNLFDGLPLF